MPKEYSVPSRCKVCTKSFLARYNTGGRAAVCTLPSHKCLVEVKVLTDGRRKVISCVDRCCRDRYRKASSAQAGSPIDSRKFLNDSEFKLTREAIRKIFDADLRMALWFILETGARLGEALLVRREHLDLRPGKLSVVSIPTEKKIGHPALPVHLDNGIPFTGELRRWVEGRKAGDPLFNAGRRTMQRTLERILDKVKPNRASLVHILRHTRASRLTAAGMDPNTIRAEMRWASIELLKVYSHTTEDTIAAALGRIRVKNGRLSVRKKPGSL